MNIEWHGRRVALTGATGFVGWHAAALLRAHGAEVHALHRAGSDVARLHRIGVRTHRAGLDDRDAMATACRGADVLIHAAGAVDFGDDWEKIRAVNVDGTANVLAAARAGGVRRIVHISSIVAVGGGHRALAQDESAEWNLGRHRVPYATTKREAETLALRTAGQDLEVVVVNPGCIIGPDDFTESEFGRMCKRFWRGRIPLHFGGGNNFVDVRDVAAGVLAAAVHGRSGERYLLTGENRTWSSFFMELARVAGRTIPRFALPSWLALSMATLLDVNRRRSARRSNLTREQARLAGLYFFFTRAKAERELGFRPRPIRQSLADAHAFWHGARAA